MDKRASKLVYYFLEVAVKPVPIQSGIEKGNIMPEHWLNIIYQYTIGGLFFFFIIFLAIKNRVLDLHSRDGKTTFWLLVGGFIFFLTAHILWTYLVTKK